MSSDCCRNNLYITTEKLGIRKKNGCINFSSYMHAFRFYRAGPGGYHWTVNDVQDLWRVQVMGSKDCWDAAADLIHKVTRRWKFKQWIWKDDSCLLVLHKTENNVFITQCFQSLLYSYHGWSWCPCDSKAMRRKATIWKWNSLTSSLRYLWEWRYKWSTPLMCDNE